MIQERKNDMASIIKRKKNYSVVYNYVDENGETKQKWETWHTHKEALKRKAEIENQQHTGTFLPPSNQTITEFLYDFVSLYGEKKWGVSMYDGQTALIANYINPIIGDMEVQAVTPRAVDGYIQTLQKTKSVSTKTRKAVTTYVSDKTIEKIIKLLRCAFKQAVRWEIIARNPFDNVILPKTEYAKRDIWTADMIRLALDKCTDSKLYVAMNLSFACSLRMGEILGLTWENVHISDEDIAADNAYVYIDKELTRASKRAIETLGEKDIYYIFTPLMPNTSTRIILKKPKTDSSIRKVWLPKTLAYILREWKKSQDELKGFLGDEYQDFDLVVALPNGRPCEDRIILKEFAKLREDAGLPKVVFHSLRHSSTTYKLKLNHGDLKATQGDTGHAEIDMITSIYAHILDEDRKVNAQKFETAFYAKPDLRNVRPPEEPAKSEPAATDIASLVRDLDTQLGPEMKSTGEVLGVAKSFREALLKGLTGAGFKMKKKGAVLISVRDSDKQEAIRIGERFEALGFDIYATSGTANVLNRHMVATNAIRNVDEPSPNIIDLIESGKIDYVVATSVKGRHPELGSVHIRRTAVERAIPCLTSMDTVSALLRCLEGDVKIENCEMVDINTI